MTIRKMKMKPRLLISACLLGQPVRYDGAGKGMADGWQEKLASSFSLLPVCPEVAGGLPIPRAAAEIRGQHGAAVWLGQARVIDSHGEDVSAAFRDGAQKALQLAREHDCQLALLKANSPSCGNTQIYSGDFDGRLREGSGVCASLLAQHDIRVFNENELDSLLALAKDSNTAV